MKRRGDVLRMRNTATARYAAICAVQSRATRGKAIEIAQHVRCVGKTRVVGDIRRAAGWHSGVARCGVRVLPHRVLRKGDVLLGDPVERRLCRMHLPRPGESAEHDKAREA